MINGKEKNLFRKMSTINEQEKKYRIKELTWEYHKNAERQDFVKIFYHY